jgi:predicted MFS family arabinose efflux permease
MGKDLGQNVSGLGVLTTAFILGLGAFQIPTGIVSARIGPRSTIIYGIAICSISTLLTAISGQLAVIAVLRFLTSIGMALVYSPGITLVARYSREGTEGLNVGLFIGAFSLGGILVIPGWAILGLLVGWRLSLAFAGFVGLVITEVLVFSLPKESSRPNFQVSASDLRTILFNRWLLVIGLAILGIKIGGSLIGYFTVYYLEDRFGVDPAVAGLIGSLYLISSLLFSLIAGRFYDRLRRPLRALFVIGLLTSLGLVIAAVGSIFAATISIILVGVSTGAGLPFGYLLARRMNELNPEYDTLFVAWVNGLSNFGGFWAPILFSYFTVSFGYVAAWIACGVSSVPLMLPVLTLRREWR